MPPVQPELTCQGLVERLTEYFDDALPRAERARLETHIEECLGCERYSEQLRITIRLVAVTRDGWARGARS